MKGFNGKHLNARRSFREKSRRRLQAYENVNSRKAAPNPLSPSIGLRKAASGQSSNAIGDENHAHFQFPFHHGYGRISDSTIGFPSATRFWRKTEEQIAVALDVEIQAAGSAPGLAVI